MRTDVAASMSIVWVSPVTTIATAAATSEALNSKNSIPALNSHPPKHQNNQSFSIIIDTPEEKFSHYIPYMLPLIVPNMSWIDLKMDVPSGN